MLEKLQKIEKKIEAVVEKRVEKKVEKEVGKKLEREFEQEKQEIEKELKGIKKSVGLVRERSRLLDKSAISVHVERYSFIFSDFDPRPFSQRALSEDFLREAKRFAFETKAGMLELHFLVPEKQRSAQIEGIIKKRLKEHFKNHALKLQKEKHEIIRNGIIVAAFGFGALAAATFIAYSEEASLLKTALLIVLEPAGWFSFWYALDSIFYGLKEKKPDLVFYKKMSKAEILFSHY